MIKAFAFDLDGTLTQHSTKIEDKNRNILKKLSEKYKLLMVGAGACLRIHEQLCGFPIDIIGNYGMQYAKFENGELKILRNDTLPVKDRSLVERTVSSFREKYGYIAFSGNGVEYHASGCITFPILGTAAKIEERLTFDPDRKKRRKIYGEVCEAFPDYNVFVGGLSSFDMVPKPFNKYYALDLWCKENRLSHDEVIFVGDDYGRGGNDESVYDSDFRFIAIDDYRRLEEVLLPWLDESVYDIDALLGKAVKCECGKMHACDIERVLIRDGALNELPALTKDFSHVLLVCDTNTYRACGERVKELLSDKTDYALVYESEGFLVPNERAVDKLQEHVSEKTDLIVGIGSGVINDLCKYVSYERGLPYYIVATAPSMDGYASSGAAMLFGGMKITVSAAVPKAIIADTSVIKNAPLEMLKAGYGDIIGKFSCLNDWRLGKAIFNEPFCDYIYRLTYKTASSVAPLGERIISRDERSVASLMRALVIVGVAMAYMGNSRPASGSEHHLSHFFEVVGLLRNEAYLCHGVDVAYSTYVTAKLRAEILTRPTPYIYDFNFTDFEESIKKVYTGNGGRTADEIISLQKKLGWIHENREGLYQEKWEEIKVILADSLTPDEVLELLSSARLPIEDFERTYSEQKRSDAIRYAKYLKDRFTVLWIYD